MRCKILMSCIHINLLFITVLPNDNDGFKVQKDEKKFKSES